MAHEQWEERLDKVQAGYVPLITNCLLAVVILAAIRDPIIIDIVPVSLIVLNAVAIALLLAMVRLARLKKFAVTNSNRFILVAVMIFALKAIALVYIEKEPYPLILAVLMFALSLCFLSQRYLLGAALVITLMWTGIAMVSLSQMQIVSTLLAIVVGCVMGLFVLERRILTLEHVFTLEKQIKNLETILPMCANCKQTRDESGNWKSVEAYIEAKKGLQITHGVCPECTRLLYGDVLNKNSVETAG